MIDHADLVARVGSPAYVYDLEAIRAAHGELAGALPAPSRLLYSLKANPHPMVVAELRRLGCGAEVSSAGEIAAALDAGHNGSELVLSGPGKRHDDLAHAVAAGVGLVSLDSVPEPTRLPGPAGDRDVRGLLRVQLRGTSGASLRMAGSGSAFGIHPTHVPAAAAAAAASRRTLVSGLHYFLGSNIVDAEALTATFVAAIQSAHALARSGVPLEVLDLGGGFAAPYGRAGEPPALDEVAPAVEAELDRLLPGWREGSPEILFESGRRLVARAGTLICTVVDVKRNGEDVVVVTDSGIHHLGGMHGLGRSLARIQPVGPGATRARLAGCLCTPLDLWNAGAEVPESIGPGDLLVVPNVGAYGLTASLVGFLSHPAPVEVVVDGDRLVSATRLTLRREAVASAGD